MKNDVLSVKGEKIGNTQLQCKGKGNELNKQKASIHVVEPNILDISVYHVNDTNVPLIEDKVRELGFLPPNLAGFGGIIPWCFVTF